MSVCGYIYARACDCHDMYVEVREQLGEVSVFLPSCRSWGLNLNCQAFSNCHPPLPVEPSCWPTKQFKKKFHTKEINIKFISRLMHIENADNFSYFVFFRILSRNPLTIVEDPYFFKLPAVKYL